MRRNELDTICPHCGVVNDSCTDAFGDCAPSPGDVSVCILCSGLGIYEKDLSLRSPTDAEDAELNRDERITAVRAEVMVLTSKDLP